MSKRKAKVKADPLPAAPPAEDNPAIPASVAELAVTAPVTTPAPMTMAELIAEEFPNGAPARMAGGMAFALQRELRRRNRKAEKGY